MVRSLALVGACLTLAVLGGCSHTPTYDEMRPDPSSIQPGDRGLQSKDLIEMTDKMAPDLLKIPEIAANPSKVVIVMTGVENRTSSLAGQDMRIYTARLRSLLNQHARDRLAFIEQRKTTQALQAAEGPVSNDTFEEASRRGAPAPSTAYQAQYALKGEFMDLANRQTSFYHCTFQLTNLRTGEIVWEGSYETRALN